MKRLVRALSAILLAIAGVSRTGTTAEQAIPVDRAEPLARFTFESADEFTADGRKIDGTGVLFGQAGPRPPCERGFATDNRAAQFGGGRGFIRIADPGPDSPYDFTAGDSITLEAWANIGTPDVFHLRAESVNSWHRVTVPEGEYACPFASIHWASIA